MPKTTICSCSIVRTTPTTMKYFINYHLNKGIDHMYLFFDDPQDKSIEALKPEKRVTCIPCDTDYWAGLTEQSPSELSLHARIELNSKIALQLAREAGYEWIICIDSDELIYSSGDLKDEIARVPAHIDLVKMPVLEAIPQQQGYASPFQGIQNFKRAPMIYRRRTYPIEFREIILLAIDKITYKARNACAYLLGCRQAFEIKYIKGHAIGKTFIRITPKIILLGSHYPIAANEADVLMMMIFPSLRLLHFDASNYETWKYKWALRYHNNPLEVTLKALGPRRRIQFTQFIDAYLQNDEESLRLLYERFYRIKESEIKILKQVGLILEINLSDELFGL